MHDKISYYFCNEIYFPIHIIPHDAAHSGINLFGSRAASIERIKQAIWLGSVSAADKAVYAKELSGSANILSHGEMLGNLFALSLIHRCFSVVISSTKLYIDKSNMQQLHKYIASTALSILPSLFLIYVVGYPPMDLILNACIIQAFSSVLSYYSLKAGNYIRSLDLISDSKKVNIAAYVSRVLTSSVIDMLLTFAWHGASLYADPLKRRDDYHMLQYCMTRYPTSGQIATSITLIYPSTPLISFADKLVWLTGRLVFDSILCKANALGYVKDIRSPFINAFSQVRSARFKFSNIQGSNIREYFNNPSNNKKKPPIPSRQLKLDEMDSSTPAAYTSDSQKSGKKPYREAGFTSKRKTRPDDIAIQERDDDKANEQNDQVAPQQMTINCLTFYKVDGQGLNNNTWGVINLRKTPDNIGLYTRSLASGQIQNSHSALKWLIGTKYEIRPRSSGYRVLGHLSKGINGFNELFPLGKSIEVYEQIKALNGEQPNLLIFDQYVKHDEIKKAISRGQ